MHTYGTVDLKMNFRPYHHKRNDTLDHISDDNWKVARRLRRSRKPLLIAICCAVALLYLHAKTNSNHLVPSTYDSLTINKDHTSTQNEVRQRIRQGIMTNTNAHDEYAHTPPGGVPSGEYNSHPSDQRLAINQRHLFHSPHDDDGSDEDQESAQRQKQEAGQNRRVELDADEEKSFQSAKKEQQNDISEHVDGLPKGPASVEPELDPLNEADPFLSSPSQPEKEKIIESEPDAHLILEEKGDSLPEIIHIPFEESVQDMVLEGWEDEWIADAKYNVDKWGPLKEPQIDFVYLWVNGSDDAFIKSMRPYEMNSVLNDPHGKWMTSHGTNRYRDWDELRYAVRSVEKYAKSFRNKIQVIVNPVRGTLTGKQTPTWLNSNRHTQEVFQVLSQEEIFDEEKHVCLPTFNSLTIENQLFNTPSTTDYMYALSDDMILTREHVASDIVSPLFGNVMGFKANAYNTMHPPTEIDIHRFGEKPFLIYTSWLLNRRFGERKRKGHVHFGHSLSRTIMREAIGSFPGPELQSACKRFRGEPGFQLYSWFVTFHYLIERHREAMLWSYIIHKADVDSDGFLSWSERRTIISELQAGIENEGKASFRKRNFYHVAQRLEKAGLKPPRVHTDHQWTSIDGPASLLNLDCSEFDVNDCLAPGFSVSRPDSFAQNPIFSSAVVYERLARTKPTCGDCLLKLLLNTVPNGLSPVLPDPIHKPKERATVVKALTRYKYAIAEPDAQFMMITDAEQIDATLTDKYVREKRQLPGQMCLNDDVVTEDQEELQMIQSAMNELYQGLFPEKCSFEI